MGSLGHRFLKLKYIYIFSLILFTELVFIFHDCQASITSEAVMSIYALDGLGRGKGLEHNGIYKKQSLIKQLISSSLYEDKITTNIKQWQEKVI